MSTTYKYLDDNGLQQVLTQVYEDKADTTHTHTKSQITDFPTVPTKTSDLSNDSNFVADSSYVHTDNNYTTTEKTKLRGIATNANNYSLPTATTSRLGGIIVGDGLSVESDGTLSASGGGITEKELYAVCPDGVETPSNFYIQSASSNYVQVWTLQKAYIPPSVTSLPASFLCLAQNLQEVFDDGGTYTLPNSSGTSGAMLSNCPILKKITLTGLKVFNKELAYLCPILEEIRLTELNEISQINAGQYWTTAETIMLGAGDGTLRLTFAASATVKLISPNLSAASIEYLSNSLVDRNITSTTGLKITFKASVWASTDTTIKNRFASKGYTVLTVS